MDDLFCYNIAAIMYIYKDYNCFIIFKPYFKPILHSDLLSDITGMSRGEVQSTSTLNDWAGYVDKINRQDWG